MKLKSIFLTIILILAVSFVTVYAHSDHSRQGENIEKGAFKQYSGYGNVKETTSDDHVHFRTPSDGKCNRGISKSHDDISCGTFNNNTRVLSYLDNDWTDIIPNMNGHFCFTEDDTGNDVADEYSYTYKPSCKNYDLESLRESDTLNYSGIVCRVEGTALQCKSVYTCEDYASWTSGVDSSGSGIKKAWAKVSADPDTSRTDRLTYRGGYGQIKVYNQPVECPNYDPISKSVQKEINSNSIFRFTINDFDYSDDDEGHTLQKLTIEAVQTSAGDLYFNNDKISGIKTIDYYDIDKLSFHPAVKTTDNIARHIMNYAVTTDGNKISNYARYTMKVNPSAINLIFNEIPVVTKNEEFPGFQINLKSYCPDGETFAILSETNPNLANISLKHGTLTAYSNYDKYGINEITLSCGERFSSTVTQKLTLNVENTVDRIGLLYSSSDITVSEGSDTTVSIPITNPDNIGISIVTDKSPIKGNLEYFADEFDNWFVKYTAIGDSTGEDNFKYAVLDRGFKVIGTVNVNIGGVNDKPFTTDNDITLTEDKSYTFKTEDFPFADPADGDLFDSVIILSVPTKGKLNYGSTAAPLNTKIPITSIQNLNYIPAKDEFGSDYTRFFFSVNDGTSSSDPGTMTINIEAENDNPEISIIEDIEILEDSEDINVNFKINDLDKDELRVSYISSDQEVIKNSNIQLTGSGKDLILKITPEKEVSDKNTVLTIQVEDNYGGSATSSFNVYVSPMNDIPSSEEFSKSAYRYQKIIFQNEDFKFYDIDQINTPDSTFTNLEITELPQIGILKLNDQVIETNTLISPNLLNGLSYELDKGRLGDDSFKFRVLDASSNSDTYQVKLSVIESPFGPNSQIANMGGTPIPNKQYGDWSCKPGYIPVLSSLNQNYDCIIPTNKPPVAEITILPQLEVIPYGSTVYLNAESSYDEDGDQLSYSWNLLSKKTDYSIEDLEVSSSRLSFTTDENLCTNNLCNIELSVNDGKTSSIKTLSFRLDNQGMVSGDSKDYSNLKINLGETYDDSELQYFNLLKGSSVVRNGKSIEVDETGKIIKYESLQAKTSSADQTGPNYIQGDGICNKFAGENSVNSPEDCEEKSSAFGIILVFSFISILSILGFVAWKKGLLAKLTKPKVSPATTSYDVPSYNQPTTQVNTKPDLSVLVRTKISQGYSEGEIKSYLIAQGHSEADIDLALSSQ